MTELEKKLTNALLMIRSHINEPEVITSIIDKNIDTDKDVLLDDTDKDVLLDDPAMNNPEAEQQKVPAEELPKEDGHFGEEQAAGLAEILKGLNEGPNDNRW